MNNCASPGAIIERMKSATCSTSDLDLAAILKIRSSTISTWKARDRVPAERIREVAEKTGHPYEWLAFGKTHHSDPSIATLTIKTGIAIPFDFKLANHEKAWLMMLRHLPEDWQQIITDRLVEAYITTRPKPQRADTNTPQGKPLK